MCETNWTSSPMPYAGEINDFYWDFGNGFVPFFAVIGAYNIFMYGDNDVTPATNMVSDAIESFNYMGVLNPIANQTMFYGDQLIFDLNDMFGHPTGEPITVTLDGNSNPDVVTADVTDNVLTLDAQNSSGSSTVSILGSGGSQTCLYEFQVSVYDPANIHVIFHLYDSYGDGWQYGGNVNYIQLGEHYITLESGEEGQYDLFLVPGEYDYTYTATDTYGSENSWTINLEDGTELGAGQGGANGTYDYTFTLEEPTTGTVEGLVSLSSTGDLTSVQVSAGGIITNPDVDGNYILTLPVGTYDVTASLEGYDTETIEDVVVTEDNATTGIDFNLLTEGDEIVIAATQLSNNYPNPFNPTTNIAYSIKDAGNVTLEVYNLRGQLVTTLVNEVKQTGNYTVIWNGRDNSNKSVSSGVYLYKMVSEGNIGRYTSTKKMILMK